MRQTCGAMLALAVLGVLLVGPLYMAVSSASESKLVKPLCTTDMGCDGFPERR